MFQKLAPVVEQCPVFIMNGETVVDVFYMPFRGEPLAGSKGKHWVPDGDTEFDFTADADRAIIESPAGCYEMVHPFAAGDTLSIGNTGASHFVRCQRINVETLQHGVEADIVAR